ncbi:MAG: putative esterase [Roseomonas sp.]|jgi:predicted alpha/beta superfamily hydrolase|nr:putative esterase [Roseomonas sp.]
MRLHRRQAILGALTGSGAAGTGLLAAPALAFAAVAATPAVAAGLPSRRPYTLPRAEEWAFTARSGRRYRVLFSWPAGEVPEHGWPVLYALDGNAMFDVLTGANRFLPDDGQGVIVAIDFPLDEAEPDRRDFEYTLPSGEAPGRHGGADALLDVIEAELKPAIAGAVRLAPARQSLFGHSYGGLFTLHAMFTRPGGFSTYLAASPSIWWGGGVLLREADAFAALPPPGAPAPRLQMTFGELEGRPRPDAPRPPPGGPRRMMGDNVRQLAARLGKLEGRFADLEVREFPGETHGSVRAAAAGRAVPFAFQG